MNSQSPYKLFETIRLLCSISTSGTHKQLLAAEQPHTKPTTMVHPSICLEMIYEDEPFADRISRVAKHGFDTVEFWTWPDKDLETIEARIQEYDISISGMSAIRETGTPPQELDTALTDPNTQAEAIEDIERSIEMASRLDCSNLMVSVGPTQQHCTHQEMYNSVVAGLREVAPVAEAAGVLLLIEPLNTAVDHPEYFVSESGSGYEILRGVDSPAVKLLFDIYHQQITEGNIIDNITAHRDRIGHIHAADVPGRNEPGTGELNYENIFGVLDNIGYEGDVGFEFRPESDTDRALDSISELVSG